MNYTPKHHISRMGKHNLIDPYILETFVCELYGIDHSLLSVRCAPHNGEFKLLAIWLNRKYAGLSYRRISRRFMCDHSAIHKSTCVAERKCNKCTKHFDPEFHAKWMICLERIRAMTKKK